MSSDSEQYDLSNDQIRVLKERAKRRAVLREEFLKEATNPFKHGSMHGGTVFDPAMQRFQAMRVSTFEHFKPNARNTMIGMGILVIPFCLYGWLLKSSRDNAEAKYRRGEVAYKDRLFKFC